VEEENNMPQPRILDFGEDPLAGAFRGFGTAFGNQTVENAQQDKLREILSSIEGGDSEMDILQKLIGARGVPQEKAANAFNAVSQVRENVRRRGQEEEQRKASRELARKEGLPEGLSVDEQTKYLRSKKDITDKIESTKNSDELGEYLENIGMEKPLADVIKRANPGVQTALVNDWLANKARNQKSKDKVGSAVEAIDNDLIEQEPPEVRYRPPGINDKEWVSIQNAREKENTGFLKAQQEKKEVYQQMGKKITRLNTLNNSGKLPSGAGLLNVKFESDGTLRVPAWSSPEAQSFEKTIAEFSKLAKDYFGSRVTNFDLQSFQQTLPRLLNSEQGRNLILKQMDIVNKIESLYANAYVDVLKNEGVRYPSQSDILGEVDNRIKNEYQSLLNDYDNIDSIVQDMNRLPQGQVLVEYNGQRGGVKKEDLKKALKNGARQL